METGAAEAATKRTSINCHLYVPTEAHQSRSLSDIRGSGVSEDDGVISIRRAGLKQNLQLADPLGVRFLSFGR